ncbi:MAG TPA: Clp protease N-terminal domain-containing protein [Gaiellaceae bacterium]
MATLHVRNVPDELYEELRAAAERDGRSIGAESVILLRRALVERRAVHETVEQVVGSASPFRQRFAARAKELVVRAQELAQEGGADETMPAHVLLAMLEDDVLRPTLEKGGVTAESVRAALPPPAKPAAAKPLVSREARRMLEQALLAAIG